MTDMPEVAMDVKGLCERLERAANWPEACPVSAGELREAATALSTLSRELAEARAERDERDRWVTHWQTKCQATRSEELKALARAESAEAASASKDERIAKLEEAIWLAHDQLNTYRSAAVDEVIDKLETYIPGLSGKEPT